MSCTLDKKISGAAIVLLFAAVFFTVPIAVSIFSEPGPYLNVATAQGAGCDYFCQAGAWVGNQLLALGALIAGLGGILLDIAVRELVLGMGTLLTSGSAMGAAVNNIWTVVRDAVNVAFIFGFIYIGIRTILEGTEGSNAKRFLAQLVIAALLINFSLFFTKLVIDVSNVLTIEINDQLLHTNNEAGIGSMFRKHSGLETLWSWNEVTEEDIEGMTSWGSVSFFVMGFIFLLIAAFVLAAGAVMIVVRFVMLIFLMIFSPVIFAARIFPQTKGYSDKLLNYLLRYSFFAPLFLFLIYISFAILQGATGTVLSGGELTQAFIDPGGNLQKGADTIILQFTVAILLLIGSLKAAQDFSIAGAGGVMKVGNSIRGGVQSWAGRNTIGRFAQDKLESFDRRQARNTLGSRALRAIGLDRTVRSVYKSGAAAKFGGGTSRTDVIKEQKETRAHYATVRGVTNLEDARSIKDPALRQAAVEKALRNMSKGQLEEAGEKVLADKMVARYLSSSQFDDIMKSDKFDDAQKRKINEARTSAIQKIYEADRSLVAKASTSHLEAMGVAYLTEARNAARLTSSQMDDLKKKLTESDFATLSKQREEALVDIAKGTVIDGLDKSHILRQKPPETAKMPADVLKQLAPELQVAVLARIALDGTINADDQKDIRSRIETAHRTAPTSSTTEQIKWFMDAPLGKQFGK